eukprot:2351638-Prymnesium_polylepis.1
MEADHPAKRFRVSCGSRDRSVHPPVRRVAVSGATRALRCRGWHEAKQNHAPRTLTSAPRCGGWAE